MRDRLTNLFLASPPADTPWTGPPDEWKHPVIERRDGRRITLDVPLFWYEPPWHHLPIELSADLAVAVAQLGIVVSALRSDVAHRDHQSPLHDFEQDENLNQDAVPTLPRLVPYRPERYGLADADFDGASIIDVRLTMHRDEAGRFAFSPSQLERWEATNSDQPVSGGSWVPSATFPPDVVSIKHLRSKLDQLRILSPAAAIFVSIGPWRLDQELRAVAENQPDGVILKIDELTNPNSNGLEIALLTQRARDLLDRSGASHVPLWVVPGDISADDGAKLVALGASAVAMDHWCEELWNQATNQASQSAARLGYNPPRSATDSMMAQIVSDELEPLVERFTGILNSLLTMPRDERLVSLDDRWREQLGLKMRIPTSPKD